MHLRLHVTMRNANFLYRQEVQALKLRSRLYFNFQGSRAEFAGDKSKTHGFARNAVSQLRTRRCYAAPGSGQTHDLNVATLPTRVKMPNSTTFQVSSYTLISVRTA